MALYQDKNKNKLPSINSLSLDEVISGKPSTAVSNVSSAPSASSVKKPSYQQSTTNKNVSLPSINEIPLDNIIKTPSNVQKVPQVQQIQQIQQQGITWKETLKYLPEQFTINNLKKTIPQAIVSTFKGAAKSIAKTIVDLADIAVNITPKNFKEKEKMVFDYWRENLKLEPTEVPGAIAAQIGEVVIGIGATKAVLTKVPSIAKFAKAFPKTFNAINSGITGVELGQIGMDNKATFKDRVKQAAIDFPTWVAFSAVGGIPANKYYAYLPSYFTIGYLSSKLEGASHQDALVSGLMTAAIGGGLHALNKPQEEKINKMRQAQLEEANRILGQYGIATELDYKRAMHKYHPDISNLPKEEATKITQAINTAWTIKKNPPQVLERSLMQEINDLINVIKSPDKARAMENIGKVTPPIALIPEQITPDGEVKPTAEPTVGPIKAPTEIKPTPAEKAPTSQTVIKAPPSEPITEITPTPESIKQPGIPEISVVKPQTEGIQPTTPPTPTVEQPVGGIKPTVKPPSQPEVITTEQQTEEVKPTIKPTTPETKTETVPDINRNIKPETYETAKKKFEAGGIYNLDNNELDAFQELNRIKKEVAKAVDEEKRDIKIVDLNIDKTGTISVDYVTRESEGELVGEIITETGKTPQEVVNKIKEENPVLKTKTEKVKPTPKESVPVVKETKPPIKPVKESTQEEILEPFSKEEQERWNTNTFYPMDYNQEYQNIVFNFKDKVVENLREYGIKEIPPKIDNLLKRHEQKVIDYLRIKGESKLKAPSPLVVGPSKYPAGKARMYASREAKAAEELQKFEDYILRQVKKAIPKGKLPQKTIDKWKKLAIELDRTAFGKRYLQEEIKNATGGYKDDLEAGLFNSVIRKQGREIWDKLQAEIKPEERAEVKQKEEKLVKEKVKIKPGVILHSEVLSGEGEVNYEAGNWKVITNTPKTIVLELIKKPDTVYGEVPKINKNIGSRLIVKKDNSGQHTFKQWNDECFTVFPFKTGRPIFFETIPKIKIPKELEPLAKEAKKYKSAEEFFDAVKDKEVYKDLLREEIIKFQNVYKAFVDFYNKVSQKAFVDSYNQAVKKAKETKITEEVKTKAKEETLAFNPENLSNPKSKKAKAEVDKIVKRSEIAKELSEKLDVTIRRGKFRQKALGIYKKHGKIIRIKGGQMLTVSHEIGHYLDDVLEDFSSKINYNETDNLIKDYSKNIQNKSESEKQVEAFGEFIRFWITEPNKATSRAPEFSKYFNERLEKYPEVKEILETARRDYKRWTEMPATSKVLSQVSIGETEQSKTIKEKFTDFYVAAKDDLYPLKQYADLLKDKKIPVEENPYILARLTRGWQDKADLFLTTGTFGKNYYKVDAKEKNKIVFKGKGLRQILQPVEKAKAMDDLIAYLTSQETINGAKTGIAKEDAEEAIKEITQRHPEMPKWAGEVYRYDRHLLEYLYEYGMIDKELFNKLKEIHSTHVPLYRVFDEIAKNGYLGKGMVNLSNQIKKRVGSERDIINPIEGLIKNTYLIINAVDRNNVGVAMANLAAADDRTARLFEKVPTPMAKVATVTAKELGIKLEDLSDEDAEKVFNIFRPSIFTPNDNTVSVLIKGKKHFYQTTPEIYNALTTTSRESANMIINFLSYPTKWLRAGATLNPDFFIAKNPIRDQLTAFVYSKYGFIPGVDFIRGLYAMVGKKDEYYLAKASGAFHTMFVSMDRKYLQKSFDDIVKEHNYTDYLKNPMEALRALSEYSEIPTRLGEFIKALNKTKNTTEAAYAFREVTLDFGKQGTAGRTINQVIAFWNAWAEGWDKLVRQFKERPLQTSWKVVLGITIPSIIFYLLNKDDPRWDEIPQWQKDSFWIIMLPNKIIRIAKPFEVGMLFGSIPERILDSINTEDPQALKDLANSLIFGQMPGILPTAIEPLVENWTNYSFFLQRPIVSESKKELPPEFQYNQYTSETSKKLGELLNYSPAKIDNLFQGWFGGIGRYATQAVDKVLIGTGISPNIPQPSPTLADIPVVKAFIVRNPIGSASKSVDRFYEQYDKFNAGERALKKMIENNEREKYFKFKEQHPELLFTYDYSTDTFYSPPARFLRQTATTLSEIRKIEQEVYNSETMTPQEKREKIDALDAIITETANQALEVLKKNGVY